MEVAARVPSADVVVLDKVILCCPDMPALVQASAAKARRLYAIVVPRDRWSIVWASGHDRLLTLLRLGFRSFVHPLLRDRRGDRLPGPRLPPGSRPLLDDPACTAARAVEREFLRPGRTSVSRLCRRDPTAVAGGGGSRLGRMGRMFSRAALPTFAWPGWGFGGCPRPRCPATGRLGRGRPCSSIGAHGRFYRWLAASRRLKDRTDRLLDGRLRPFGLRVPARRAGLAASSRSTLAGGRAGSDGRERLDDRGNPVSTSRLAPRLRHHPYRNSYDERGRLTLVDKAAGPASRWSDAATDSRRAGAGVPHSGSSAWIRAK